MSYANLIAKNTLHRVPKEIRIQKLVMNNCENIAQLYDAFTSETSIFVILEFCDYSTVDTYLKLKQSGSGVLSEPTSRTFFLQLLNAITHLQKHNIVHRDIKLQNLLLTRTDAKHSRKFKWQIKKQKNNNNQNNNSNKKNKSANKNKKSSKKRKGNNNTHNRFDSFSVTSLIDPMDNLRGTSKFRRIPADKLTLKLADFGLAAQLTDENPNRQTMCGTPNFVAPEIARNEKHGLPADIFSCAVVLFTMLMGKPPFQNSDLKVVLHNIKTLEPCFDINNKINNQRQDLTDSCKDLLTRMFDKRPKNRLTLSDIYNHPWITGGIPPSPYMSYNNPQEYCFHTPDQKLQQSKQSQTHHYQLQKEQLASSPPPSNTRAAKYSRQYKNNGEIHKRFQNEYVNANNKVYCQAMQSHHKICHLLKHQPNLQQFMSKIEWLDVYPCCEVSHEPSTQTALLIDSKKKECRIVQNGLCGMWIKWDNSKNANDILVLENIERSCLDRTLKNLSSGSHDQLLLEDEKMIEFDTTTNNNNNKKSPKNSANWNLFEIWGVCGDYKHKNANNQLLQLNFNDINTIINKFHKQHVYFGGFEQLLHKYYHWYVILHKAIDSVRKHLPQVLINLKPPNPNWKTAIVRNHYDCCLFFRNGNMVLFFKPTKDYPNKHQS